MCLEPTNFPACTQMSCSGKEIIHSGLTISRRGLRAGWDALCGSMAECLLKSHGQVANANLSLLHSYSALLLWPGVFYMRLPSHVSCCLTVHFCTDTGVSVHPLPYKGRNRKISTVKLAYRNCLSSSRDHRCWVISFLLLCLIVPYVQFSWWSRAHKHIIFWHLKI